MKNKSSLYGTLVLSLLLCFTQSFTAGLSLKTVQAIAQENGVFNETMPSSKDIPNFEPIGHFNNGINSQVTVYRHDSLANGVLIRMSGPLGASAIPKAPDLSALYFYINGVNPDQSAQKIVAQVKSCLSGSVNAAAYIYGVSYEPLEYPV